MPKEEVHILGGGLVGSLTALFLGRQGYPVFVYEKRPDYRTVKEEGRSINLALSDRGWRALAQAGIAEQIREIALPMPGRIIHAPDGQTTFQAYGKADQAIYAISRNDLNARLIDLADALPNVQFCFQHECTTLDLRRMQMQLRDHAGKTHHIQPEILLGTDGAFSMVRRAMQFIPHFNFQQHYIEHDYKELTIPATPNGTFAMDPKGLHIWPRGRFMLIALPNTDKSFTCTLFLSSQAQSPSFADLETEAEVLDFFRSHFPDVLPLIPNLTQTFFRNPTAPLLTVHCSQWTYNGVVGMLGDAAHAIVPFYGQGMNAGFEDARIFAELLEQTQGDWVDALEEFEKARMKNAAAISELALNNFIEMRDSVADPNFLLRKKIEAHMHAHFPDRWMPLYSMVTFSHIPYAEALRIGREQDKFMKKLMATLTQPDDWQHLDFEQWLKDAPLLPDHKRSFGEGR